MPVTESITGKGCVIECWTITESAGELENLCRRAGIEPVNTFALEDRYKQHMTTLLLFNRLFTGHQLRYHSTGKPYVTQGPYVSISHSADTVVMMRADAECGTDIEGIHPRVAKVRRKFLNDDELVRVQDADTETLVRYWTAKEAMFKVYGSETVFMRSNIFVDSVTASLARAELRDGDLILKRTIQYRVVKNMILAWTETTDEA
jgi:phosphopantetheinyl transferase